MNYFGSKPVEKYVNAFHIYSGLNDSFAAGWGRKKSFYRAEKFATEKQCALLCLEDGFIRSIGLGVQGVEPFSIVVDDLGIYFDARTESRLERLIQQPEQFNPDAIRQLMQVIVKNKITKYNMRYSSANIKKIDLGVYAYAVLVVDQTYGDQSIRCSGATPQSFKTMLKQACLDHPQAKVIVKTHPDVIAGFKKGHFHPDHDHSAQIHWCVESINPFDLLLQVLDVYVVSSHFGFEALLAGHQVHCFGVPWYAGWGLTDDQYAPVEILQGRRQTVCSLEHLFHCAYIQYARYLCPITHQLCSLEDILKLIIANLTLQNNVSGSLLAYQFSPWKKRFIKDFLGYPKTQIQFKKWFKPDPSEQIVAWGKKAYLLKQQGYPHVLTVEDGFIRSIGLGASLIRPCSLVFDDVGIYYDATQPSRIENLLKSTVLDAEQIQRAEHLRQKLIQLNLTKYNVGHLQPLNRPETDQKVLLVIGQVEDDMSICLGGVAVKTNLALLKKVRESNPHAYIVYKPHPDVQAGLRTGKIEQADLERYANQLELNASILSCFEVIDEVHTITSLTGFEALLRGIPVYCYGLPFYAGWGLTKDDCSCERRDRKLDLNTLIYVTLIEYAVYNLPKVHYAGVSLVTAEHIIDYLQQQLNSPLHQPNSLWKKIITKVTRLKNR